MEFLNCGDRLLVGSALSDLEPATSNSKTPPLVLYKNVYFDEYGGRVFEFFKWVTSLRSALK